MEGTGREGSREMNAKQIETDLGEASGAAESA